MPFILSEKPRSFNENESSYIVVKAKATILTDNATNQIFFDSKKIILSAEDQKSMLYIGELNKTPVFALEKDSVSTCGKSYKHASEIMDLLTKDELTAFFRAALLLNWDISSKHCGACGDQLQFGTKEFVKSCCNCKHQHFPQYSAAIVTLVLKKHSVLLARSPHFKKGMYCPLAGFIESGETAVQAVHREVMEEVNIKVKNVRYFGSEPWPFPNSLLFAYLADYESGELKPNYKEIEDAAWFHYSKEPETLPLKSGLSYRLMQAGRALCKEDDLKSAKENHFFLNFKRNGSNIKSYTPSNFLKEKIRPNLTWLAKSRSPFVVSLGLSAIAATAYSYKKMNND